MTPASSQRVTADMASRAALLSLGSNIVLMVLKVTVGIISGSIAVLSDGIDSAQDVVASGIVLVSVRIGRRPPDEEHPYGHGRAETIAAMLQAALITLGAGYILYRGVERLIRPVEQIDSTLALAAITTTAVVNFAVVLYVQRVARLTNSPAIASDARHLWTNIVQAVGIFVALVLVAVTDELIFDALVALALGAYLLWIAGSILWTSVSDILDVSLKPEDIAYIEQCIIGAQRDVLGFHDLRTRRSGQHRHIDFHVLVRGDMTVSQSHQVVESIEAAIHHRWPSAVVMVHVDPKEAEEVQHLPVERPQRRGDGSQQSSEL
jgi:cation diffusion facilitator family transporter